MWWETGEHDQIGQKESGGIKNQDYSTRRLIN